MTTRPAWSPILDGALAVRADAAITAVAAAVKGTSLPPRHTGAPLAAGEAGIALFYAYLDRARPGAGHGETAEGWLDRAFDVLVSSAQSPSLFGGFTGVAWVAEHLREPEMEEDAEADDPNADIDAALLRYLRQTPWRYHYDLTAGLVGYAVYALERLPRPSAVTSLELVVEHLAEIAQARPEGLAWHTPLELLPEPNRPWNPQGNDNLGIAHGTPGVIAVLARICAAGIAVERVRSLLAGAVPWLLAQKLPSGGRSVFPYMVGREIPLRPARTAWCYGDPGIALALLAAGRAAAEPEWEREALALARTVAQRPPEDCGVDDAGLCHGAAGLGHVLNRLYQATGDPEILTAARAWFERALGFWEPGRGIGGFLTFTPPEDDFERLEWNEEAGFLTGSAGIALTLLAATGTVDPAWDRLLLLSPLHG
ncbi:MAG TPA: lanthionine synthetase C family protein [Thermoanaerobaculia bacterium]|jgi:lantibiotic modifying enzyme|nr:lanthionine synthetase C family protein [Thermoanaerobaculia bacterium]